jgi:xylan 1,4-beta-xylosidase
LSRPLHKPKGGGPVLHVLEELARKFVRGGGLALSDDFSTNKSGVERSFYDQGADEMQRVRVADNTLFLKAKGAEPRDSLLISFKAERNTLRPGTVCSPR